MRLSYLFMLGFIPLFLSCKTNSSVLRTQTHSADSLANYTYLIISVQKNKDRPGSKEAGNSSGFFIRDSSNKLFLVSALHVFRGCSIFVDPQSEDSSRMVIPDTLKVWYQDSSGHYKFQDLPVTAYKAKPCRRGSALADLDTMDVSAYFKDGKIFSIEGFVPRNSQKGPVAGIGDSVVCYGFFKDGPQGIPPVEGDSPVLAVSLPSRVIDIPDTNLKRLDSIYTAIQPAFKDGYSGAPIFKITSGGNKGKPVEFAGVQSGNASDTSFSVMVKGNAMNWGDFFNGNKTVQHR
jgi:hypothetical protein